MKTIVIGNTVVKTARISPSFNWRGEYELFINTTKSPQHPRTELIKTLDDGLIYFGEENGLVRFCFIEKNDKTKYEWITRSGIVNQYIPKQKHCLEAVVDNGATALTLNKIQEILDEYFPNQFEIGNSIYEKKEIRYAIHKK